MIKMIVSFTDDQEYLALVNLLYSNFQIYDSDIPSSKSPFRRKCIKLNFKNYPGRDRTLTTSILSEKNNLKNRLNTVD